jgi:alkylation response protein AidB-like acyl-CoA dehydrogenase
MSALSLLESTEIYLREVIAPIANDLDENAELLRSALQGLGDRNLLALRLPKSWNGAAIDEVSFATFQEQVARFSGALAFLQTQHQSAAAMLAKSENLTLQQTYLPFMGTGEKLVGIGFSHLRRDNSPLKAIPIEGGYQLQGQVPWITGFGFFQSVLIAALLPDGQAVYGMVPFSNSQPSHGGKIQFSQPMPLAAMTATNTVTAELTQWFLSDPEVAFVVPAGAIHRSDRANVLNHSFFALGCAQAGLDLVESVQKTKPFLSIAPTQTALATELQHCRNEIYAAQREVRSFEEKLKLRAWAIELAVRCAHAAVIVSSGAANSKQHPAQRIYREALVFSVAGQTITVLEASLDRLTFRRNF